MRQIISVFATIVFLCFVSGCGGDREPINEGKDRPVPKKDK